MTNKSRVSKEVFQLLKRVEEEDDVERLVSAVADKSPYLYREYEEAKHLDLHELMKALVNGYEVEKTPEEKVREYYLDSTDSEVYSRAFTFHYDDAIRTTLDLLGIKIEGVNV